MRKKLWILVLLIAGGLQMLQAQIPEQVINLQDLATQLKQKSQTEKAQAVRVANQKGWPVRTVDENGRITELMRLDEKGMPVYYITYNANGAALINSDELYTGGAAGLSLSGSGQTLGIWDGGDVRTTHVELTGRITDKDGVSPYGIEDHPTHVAGTMIASGVDAAAKGMSFAASLDAYDWTDDEAEMIAAAADGLNVSQHSYGQIAGWAFGHWYSTNEMDPNAWHWFGDYTIDESENYFWGYYSNEAQYWDYISQISPNYLIVKSAGNDRGEGITSGAHYAYKYSDGTWVSSSTARLLDGGTTGYQTVAHSATSKNVMTVGAVDNTTAMSSFSGWGPTDDGRIKPDIVAKGVSVYSSLADADNNSYASWNGTSMSGPMVSGSVGLLLEHQENLHPGVTLRSATIKGLILHTATDLGNAGPDYVYGWGLMNTQAAAEVMTDNASGGNHIVEASLSNGATKTYYIEATGGEPVVATIIWTDPYGAVPTPSLNPTDLILVNDLDMQIEDASSTVFNPYILDPANPGNAATTGDNIRDNIEKIVIASPTAGGVYALTISHKATLNDGSQDYSLIITGNTSLSTTTTLPYAETFDTDLGDCYTYSVSGATKNWYWQDYNGNGFAKMNGYNSGDTEEDWLILPGINADDYTTITMNFETAYNFGTDDADNYLKLFYSTDYNGVGDPSSANWTELAFTQPGVDGYVYVNSGDIDLSAISGQFYLAFKYRGTDGNYRTWQIDNINIFQELITFYFRGPNWMDNNPHNPEVWGPFNGWSGAAAMTYDNTLEWWKTTIQVADAAAEITYQSRFAQGGTTKYQKAFGDFGANPTFTTTTGEIWIDASDNASFSWSGNDFYLAQDKITETQPLISEPASHVTNLAISADSESQISLSWTDSDAAYYLIKGSTVGYADISDPVDGTAEADGLLVKNIGSTIQSVSFSGLDAATTYYFKVFPYNGTGSTVNYKTDGTVPQESATTNSSPYYYAGMEGDGETKGSYGSDTVTISDIQWDLTEALIGTLATDYKTGIRSVRMRGYGTSAMTMLEDKAGGIGSIYFNYRRYGTDAQVDWKVEYSTDGGSNWTQIGSVFTAPDSDEVQTFHEKVNVDGNIRLRIKRETETGSSNRRLNIDDIIVTNYNTIGLLADISAFDGFDVNADALYASGTLFNPNWPEPGSNSDALFSRLGITDLFINIFNITDGTYSYKYFKNTSWSNGEWGAGPDRSRSLSAGDLAKDIVSYLIFTGNGNISIVSNWQAADTPSEQNVIIYGDAIVDEAFSVLDLIIEDEASVTVQAGQQLTVSNTLTNNAGTAALFLQSDATGTASLLHNTADVDMTIQRYLTGDANTANAKYHTVSVPLTAASNPQTGLFMGAYLYRFDFATQDYVSMGTSTTTPLDVDEGYLLYYPDANITYDFAGKANNGSFAAAVAYGVGNHYNLVPNPFPSAINWDAASGWTKTNMNNAVYVYNTGSSSQGNIVWASYVDGTGTNGGTNIIPAGQAFFVQSNAAAPVLSMTNEVRVHNSQAFFKEKTEETETLRLFAHSGDFTDEIVVRYLPESSYDFDGQYDALKFKNWSAAPNIYSLTPDKTELSINSIPYSTETYLMEVGFEWNGSGEVAIEVQGIESFGEWVSVFLDDLLTGARIDLRDQNTYSFIHEADNDPLRFNLRFMGVTGADELSNAENDTRIWSADRMLHLSHFGKVPTLVEVFDMQGRLLYSQKLNGNSSSSIGELPLDQVLIVRLSSNESVTNQKVIIR